ncbi:hypothetical protein CC1G_08919 [Coprinopsis cinerea okayama7|uniref:Uncharacterized protein n=1 Tax=Coprinopsis cinerea (strain Okayama-7 / 130 / ATCC MYA-4618 / FGSC 9003) TaxID=240176 RepID=A8P8B9_COPC7|nr:hypothetical protein CC1G_08919 [Coprinopsis cinerea okayama7\|eukprot:XP_001839540.2 hypothetical protein CC1G_08919 [Coprinopsis cinerea okayama7\
MSTKSHRTRSSAKTNAPALATSDGDTANTVAAMPKTRQHSARQQNVKASGKSPETTTTTKTRSRNSKSQTPMAVNVATPPSGSKPQNSSNVEETSIPSAKAKKKPGIGKKTSSVAPLQPHQIQALSQIAQLDLARKNQDWKRELAIQRQFPERISRSMVVPDVEHNARLGRLASDVELDKELCGGVGHSTPLSSTVKTGSVTEVCRIEDDGQEQEERERLSEQSTNTALLPKVYSYGGRRVVEPTDSDDEEQALVGGLDEGDIDDIRPQFKDDHRNPGMLNDLVSSPVKLKHDVKQKPMPSKGVLKRGKSAAISTVTPTQPSKPLAAIGKGKALFVQPSSHLKPPRAIATPTPSPTIRSSKLSIPASLNHALYLSEEPFQHFRSDSPEFLHTVSDIYTRVYGPHVDVDAEAVSEAYRQINVKRSKIASEVFNLVKLHFQGREYITNPGLVRSHARWGLRGDGFAWYAKPAPIAVAGMRGKVANYVEPDGLFQSPFIVKTAKKFMKHADGSKILHPMSATNPPIGLYTIILASLYRAFQVFLTNPDFLDSQSDNPKSVPKFSSDNFCEQIGRYSCQLKGLSTRRWEAILEPVMAPLIPEAPVFDIADLSDCGEDIYVPASPVKRR